MIPAIQNDTWKRIGGIEKLTPEQTVQIQLTKNCKRCGYENPRDSTYCNRCAFNLDEKKAAEAAVVKSKVDALLNRLTESPEKLDKLIALVET